MPPPTAATDRPWWRGATIYELYPRSFADSDGDGVGDFAGIIARLDHVASLGVDAIWLCPFYPSPMRDFGYDVADYCNIDPLFGTLADLDRLVGRAHALGLRVIIDQVFAHTADTHPWFTDSRSSRNSARADWYVWADAKGDGSPPTNWQSVFSGPAWTWDARRGQYYMHNFLSGQPQLNVRNPAVQDALLAVLRFWLDRGIDGFRLDAINFAMHDPLLRDNPPAPPGKRTRPFDFQTHRYNQSHPDILPFLERIHATIAACGDRFTVAEIGGDDAGEEMRCYTAPGRLDSAYGFEFLYASALTPAVVAGAIATWGNAGWPSWAFANHDAPRVPSRWAALGHGDAMARLALLLLVCLRGTAIVWQGEELGLHQVDIDFADLRDPEAIANWPLTLSRDGARTPMPWRANVPNAGFSTATPWLPVGDDNVARAVDRQETDIGSVLHDARIILALRRRYPALAIGEIEGVDAGDAVLTFERRLGDERLLCVFNLDTAAVAWSSPAGDWYRVAGVNGATADRLPPYGALVLAAGDAAQSA